MQYITINNKDDQTRIDITKLWYNSARIYKSRVYSWNYGTGWRKACSNKKVAYISKPMRSLENLTKMQ